MNLVSWLPSKDSNLDNEIQILGCYHYTTGQKSQCRNDFYLRKAAIKARFHLPGVLLRTR